MRNAGRWSRMTLAATFWLLAYQYLTIPDVRPLLTTNPTSTAFIDRRQAEAERRGARFVKRQRFVSYGRISFSLKRAVLVAEDSAFWRHEGVDLDQIRESLEVNLERMEFARGASTITQQLAKNLYLSPSKNPVRKLRELMIARRLEAVLSKRRILELYLNLIEWGDGVFGAEAASRAYFGVAASSLSPEESAMLAAAIINPRLLNPAHPSARLVRRQRMLLRRMGRVLPPSDAPVRATEPVESLPRPGGPPLPAPANGPAQPPTPGADSVESEGAPQEGGPGSP